GEARPVQGGRDWLGAADTGFRPWRGWLCRRIQVRGLGQARSPNEHGPGLTLSAALDLDLVRAADHFDVVINNAGRGSIGPIEAFSMTQIERLMRINARGPRRSDRAVCPSMKFQLRPDPLAK